MILTTLGPVTAYRMHTPKWAVAPSSGAGAATHGGRANRPGIAALYFALHVDVAARRGVDYFLTLDCRRVPVTQRMWTWVSYRAPDIPVPHQEGI